MSIEKPQGEPGRGRLSAAWPAVAAALAPLAFFARQIFAGDAFLGRDMARVYVPTWAFWAEQLRAGRWPLWFPSDGLGEPLLGLTVGSALHPAHLLSLVLSPALAVSWAALLSLCAASLGAWRLGRRLGLDAVTALLPAALYAFNGYALGLTCNLPYLLAMGAVPWALAAALSLGRAPSTRGVASLAVALVLVLVSGDPQAWVVSCGLSLAAAALVSASPLRALVLSSGAALASAGLGAVQLVAGAEVMRDAAPGGLGSAAAALQWSGHPLRLLEAALGPLFLNPERDAFLSGAVAERILGAGTGAAWAESMHFGLAPLLLAGVGAAALWRSGRGRAAVVLFAVGAVLWLGRHAGLYEALRVFPPWRVFRYPEKLTPFLALGAALAAGLALAQGLADGQGRRRLSALLAAGAGGTLALVALDAATGAVWPTLTATAAPPAAILEQLSRTLLRCGLETAAATLVAAAICRWVSLAHAGAALAAVVLGHAALADAGVAHAADPQILTASHPFLEVVRASPPARVASSLEVYPRTTDRAVRADDWQLASMVSALRPLTPALHGLDSASTYLPAASERVHAVEPWLSSRRAVVGPLAGLFSVGFWVAPASELGQHPEDRAQVVAEDAPRGAVLVQSPWVAPAAAVLKPLCVADRAQALARLVAADFDLRTEAVVECGAALEGPQLGGGTATVTLHQPSRVEVEVEAAGAGVVVLNDAAYSGWSATVDGAAAPLWPANVAVRAVPVPPGRHQVVFGYRPPGLVESAALSAACWGLLVLALLRARPLGKPQGQTGVASST